MLGRSPHDAGSASSVGLAVAAGTLMVTFAVAEIMVGEPAGIDARHSTYASASSTALAVLVSDEGASSSGKPWEQDADRVIRFGLAKEGQRNFLDYAKIKALRNGSIEADPRNGDPDYPEIRDALGLREGDFHLRTYPVLPGMDDPRWTRETHGRLAYFARYSGAAAAVSAEISHDLSAARLNVSLRLTNAAPAPAIFQATVSMGNVARGTVLVSEDRHTGLLAPGAAQTVWVEFPSMAWDASVTGFRVEVQDPYGNPAVDPSGVAVGPRWFAVAPPTAAPRQPAGFLVHASDFYAVAGDRVTFHVDHYTGSGGKTNSAQGRFVLVGPDGDEWVNVTTGTLPNQRNQVWTYECRNCTEPGGYTAVLWDHPTSPMRRHVDRVHVSATRLFEEKTNMDPLAVKEIALLSQLVVGFNPTRYHAADNPTGDVFGDDSNDPGELVAILGRYTTLVVGSEVSQTALAPAGVKYGIAQWVQDGGNLVVLGTLARESRWLEPVYHAAQDTANGGISAPDPTHPILQTPNRLSYQRYVDRARAWDVDDDAPFVHVLTRGGAGGSHDDTIAVSEPGAYNNGTVVLTSYMPGSLTSPQDDAEAKRFLHNLLSQSHTMLFLDYGPPITPGVPVGTDSRLVAVPHPNVPGAVVEVRLVMYVFG